MTDAQAWDASEAIARCPAIPLKHAVWRGHRPKYDALDATGSSLVSARYHVAPRNAGRGCSWHALYTSLDLAVAIAEIERNIPVTALRDHRFTEIWVQLEVIIDCRERELLGVSAATLLDDYDYSTGQALARAALSVHAEGILVPSATNIGDNLILFPDQIRTGSVLQEVRFVDPVFLKRPTS